MAPNSPREMLESLARNLPNRNPAEHAHAAGAGAPRRQRAGRINLEAH